MPSFAHPALLAVGLGGGYVIEQFLGASIRARDDIDIVVYRDEQLQVQRWLADWRLYAADPPGDLRAWSEDEDLPYGTGLATATHAHRSRGDEWFGRRDTSIRGRREDLIVAYNGIPCVRIEVQLLYKAKNARPKDELDFQASLPRLSVAAKQWLRDNLRRLYPKGHAWINAL